MSTLSFHQHSLEMLFINKYTCIVKLITIIRCRKNCYYLSICKKLVAIFYHITFITFLISEHDISDPSHVFLKNLLQYLLQICSLFLFRFHPILKNHFLDHSILNHKVFLYIRIIYLYQVILQVFYIYEFIL